MAPRVTRSKIELVATAAALRAAQCLKKHLKAGVQTRFKGEINLVTQADLDSQKIITGAISKAFPSHDILAEEESLGHGRPLDGPIWVIDPLDGTTNYAHGFPMFAISIAYREGGETLFGLAYHPLLKEMFIAHRGKGATLNGKKIQVSKTDKLTHSLLATGFPYDRRTSPNNNLNYFCHFEMTSQCVRRAGAAVLDLANVACGRFDGFWEWKLSPWDIASGMLLISEAGGVSTDYSGKPIEDFWCGQLLSSNGRIHDQMLEGLRVAEGYSINSTK